MKELVTIPDAKYAPKPIKTPSHQKAIPNFADKEKTVEKVLTVIKGFHEHFKTQAERKSLLEKMEQADRMLRCSKVEDTSSDQHQPTMSNYPSLAFWKRHRTLTSQEKAIILGSEEMPARFDPIPDCADYTEDEGTRVAEGENLMLFHAFDRDNTRFKMGQSIYYVDKYGQELISSEYDYRTEEREDRVRIQKGQNTAKFKWEKRNRVIADNPTYIRHDLRWAWYDCKIDDMQKQQCIILMSVCGLADIWQEVRDGHYVKPEGLDARHLFFDEDDDDTLQTRKTNAGDESSSDYTGQFVQYNIWVRVPIDDKGVWNEDEVLPTWHWATFIGYLNNEPICVRLNPNPYHHKGNPFKLIHAYEDDKGAVHMGLVDILQANDDEVRVTVNEMIDNKTLRTKKQTIVEQNSLLTKDLTAGANKVIVKRPGTPDPHEIEIQDTTITAIPFLRWLEEDGDKAAGTDKPIIGEAMGGRTAATEARNVYKEAMKIMLDKAYYLADQLLPWVAEQFSELWRQYADPKRVVAIDYQGQRYEVKPSELWGPMRVTVTSVKKFEEDAMSRMEENNLIATGYQFLAALMGREGATEFWRQVLKRRKYRNVDSFFPKVNDYEAREVARMENDQILYQGQWDAPKQEENQEIHLEEHESFLAAYKALPAEQQNAQNMALLVQHIAVHHYMQIQAQRQMALMTQGITQQPQQQVGPETTGQAAGDLMGAQTGGMNA